MIWDKLLPITRVKNIQSRESDCVSILSGKKQKQHSFVYADVSKVPRHVAPFRTLYLLSEQTDEQRKQRCENRSRVEVCRPFGASKTDTCASHLDARISKALMIKAEFKCSTRAESDHKRLILYLKEEKKKKYTWH